MYILGLVPECIIGEGGKLKLQSGKYVYERIMYVCSGVA